MAATTGFATCPKPTWPYTRVISAWWAPQPKQLVLRPTLPAQNIHLRQPRRLPVWCQHQRTWRKRPLSVQLGHCDRWGEFLRCADVHERLHHRPPITQHSQHTNRDRCADNAFTAIRHPRLCRQYSLWFRRNLATDSTGAPTLASVRPYSCRIRYRQNQWHNLFQRRHNGRQLLKPERPLPNRVIVSKIAPAFCTIDAHNFI